MPLPNVLVIGAQKCGTTALYKLLERHPQCSSGAIKETHFFVDESPYPFGRWSRGLNWYSQNYEDRKYRIDLSPSYSGWPLFPGVAERAAATLPSARIIYLLREPVDRMISHWMHWCGRGYEHRSCEEALLDPSPMNVYVIGSSYTTQLERWSRFYPESSILLLPQSSVFRGAHEIWQWLGLEPPEDTYIRANVADQHRIGRRYAGIFPRKILSCLPACMVSKPIEKPMLTVPNIYQLRERLQGEMRGLPKCISDEIAPWA